MRISLAGLKKGPQSHRQTGPASRYLNDADTFSGDLRIKVALRLESGILHLALEADLEGHFLCDRCGVEFDRTLAMMDDFFLAFENHPHQAADSDVHVIPRDALEIDISQEIRDLVMLNLPLQTLCREDCHGLCSICGANLNEEVDHRHEESDNPSWVALKKLKEKE